jgi:hypothetical protein
MKNSNRISNLIAGLSLMGLFNIATLAGESVPTAGKQDLAKGFASPPASARPWVYYFPLSGNLTKEGITADFEAMARVGIGGLLYMEVDQGTPKGPADFAGPLWMDLFKHACNEAHRLGIQINMNNDAGWTGSGGPWITPDLSAQTVVWTETMMEGGKKFEGVLAKPAAARNYYEDIAVLAFPTPAADTVNIGEAAPKVTGSGTNPTPGHYRIENIRDKASFWSPVIAPAPADWPVAPADAVIASDRILDLTGKMDAAGKLTYDFPPGNWTVIRFGHTTTGSENHPAPATGRGLECDKLSKKAAKAAFDGLMGRLVKDNQALTGQDKALVSTHIDSWEAGCQNWTPLMRKEFKQRRGYELLNFLPTFTGRVVDSIETTERFLWDLRQTISDLLVENYAAEFRRLANNRGLRLSIEAYGGGPFDEMAYGGQADEPMAEFWAWEKFDSAFSCTEMASSAHIYGKKILAAEAFTSWPAERWLSHPANMKDLGDWAFCEGVNRFVFHRYAAQPWTNPDRAPGMSMGPFGVHYERTQTWWEQSKAWHKYLARCQYLLQQGLFVADVVYLQPEGAPRRFISPAGAEIAPHIRSGYNFDGCTPDVVLERMSVKNGRIVLPDGMSYAVLVLPEVETMTPKLLRKISQLVDQGATVIGGRKPPQKSPSLTDMGRGDADVKKLADELWGSGKILIGKTAAEVLAARGVKPDFSSTPILRYTHRTLGDTEVYFVANPEPQEIVATASFRMIGKQPEFWRPDSGRTADAIAFQEKDGGTQIPLRLEPSGSIFIIFRKSSTSVDPIISATRNGQPALMATSRQAESLIIQKARYGDLNDPQRTRDVTAKVQALVDGGKIAFQVSDMATGGDPAYGTLKTLAVDYSAGGNAFSATGQDGEAIMLSAPGVPPALDLASGEIEQSGDYVFTKASGKTWQKRVSLPEAQGIKGPWQVSFDPKWGGPAKVTFDKPEDWSKRPEEGIKYYSGTAIYQTIFNHTPPATPTKIWLDLGKVAVMAEVKLNGKDLGILWKPPFRVEVTDAIRAGENQLEVKVVNLWINRQIGDEQLPEDSDRNMKDNGSLNAWPQWLQEGKPSPTGRFTFGSHRLWKKNDRLAESGLLGPVTIQSTDVIK